MILPMLGSPRGWLYALRNCEKKRLSLRVKSSQLTERGYAIEVDAEGIAAKSF